MAKHMGQSNNKKKALVARLTVPILWCIPNRALADFKHYVLVCPTNNKTPLVQRKYMDWHYAYSTDAILSK